MRLSTILASIVCIVLACFGRFTSLASADIPDVELDFRLQLAAQYLTRIQDENGQFRYEYNFVTSKFSKKNSIVRQAGTAHALAEYLRASADERFAPAVKNAVAMLQAQSVSLGDGLVVTVDGDIDKARTGATALALLTVTFYAQATGDESYESFQASLIDGLAELQLPDGHFESTPGSGEYSPYFDGEAWYALAEFNRKMPDHHLVSEMLETADGTMIDYYTDNPDIGFSHWGMLAASTRYRATGEARFLDFLEHQGAIFIDELRPEHKPRVNNCYSIEGLGSAAVALAEGGRRDNALWSRIVARVDQDTRNNNRFQILPGQGIILLGPKSKLIHDRLKEFEGAFLNGQTRPQTRIDFTQHCMSALLKYKALKTFGDIERKTE